MFTTTLITPASTTRLMSDLSPEQNARVLALAKELRKGYSSATAFGRAIGMTQGGISAYLSGKNGASLETATRIAALGRVPLETLLSTKTRAAPELSRPVLGNLPGFHTAMIEAKRREPFYPQFAWDDAAAISPLIAPARVDADMVLNAARLAVSLRTGSQLEEAEGERIDDEEREREARQVEGERRVREAEARGEKLSLAKAMTQVRREREAQAAARAAVLDDPPPPSNDKPRKP